MLVHQNPTWRPKQFCLFCLSFIWFLQHFVDILLACECLHCAFLLHCWSIVNVDVSLIFAQGNVSRNTVPRAVFPRTLRRGGSVLENMISVDHIIRYHPCEYQEIHSYSGMNIGSVQITTSPIMLREWIPPHLRSSHIAVAPYFFLIWDVKYR